MRHARVLLLKHLLSPCSQVSLADGTALVSQCPLPGGRQDMLPGGRQDMLGQWAAGPSALATTEGHGHHHNSSAVSSTVNFSATVPEPCTLDAVLISETLDINVSALTVTYSSRSSTIPAPQPFRAAIPKLLPNTWAAPYQLNQKVRERKPGFSRSSGDFNFRQFGNHNQRGIQSLDATVFQRLSV